MGEFSIEVFSLRSQVDYPFDLGFLRNLQSVFGTSPLRWCVPSVTQGDGVAFEVADGLGRQAWFLWAKKLIVFQSFGNSMNGRQEITVVLPTENNARSPMEGVGVTTSVALPCRDQRLQHSAIVGPAAFHRGIPIMNNTTRPHKARSTRLPIHLPRWETSGIRRRMETDQTTK